jgi:hypothetical protein
MRAKFGLSGVCAASVCFVLLASIFVADRSAIAQEMHPILIYDVAAMSADQILTRDQMTGQERDYYDTLKDPVAARGFIMTRSYVRVCQRVVDHTLPALQLPPKPPGFTAAYLLPDDADIINKAIGEYLQSALTRDLQHP